MDRTEASWEHCHKDLEIPFVALEAERRVFESKQIFQLTVNFVETYWVSENNEEMDLEVAFPTQLDELVAAVLSFRKFDFPLATVTEAT